MRPIMQTAQVSNTADEVIARFLQDEPSVMQVQFWSGEKCFHMEDVIRMVLKAAHKRNAEGMALYQFSTTLENPEFCISETAHDEMRLHTPLHAVMWIMVRLVNFGFAEPENKVGIYLKNINYSKRTTI